MEDAGEPVLGGAGAAREGFLSVSGDGRVRDGFCWGVGFRLLWFWVVVSAMLSSR